MSLKRFLPQCLLTVVFWGWAHPIAPERVLAQDASRSPIPDFIEPPAAPRLEAEPVPAEQPNFSLPTSPPQPELPNSGTQSGVRFPVHTVQIRGNRAIADHKLRNEIRKVMPFPNDNAPVELTQADVSLAIAAITQYYAKEGYLTTGAGVEPAQDLAGVEFLGDLIAPNGVLTFKVIEGFINREDIVVSGNRRLDVDYVISRLARATATPLNNERLVAALQLLHNDPLIKSIDATIVPGTVLGQNILQVQVQEAKTLQAAVVANNYRSRNSGVDQQVYELSTLNFSGVGDRFALRHTTTQGSDGFFWRYSRPLNARDGMFSVSYSHSSSQVIEPPVDLLDINSDTDIWDFTWRQPLLKTMLEEFAVSLTFSHWRNRTVFGEDLFGFEVGFPAGDGRSRSTALRFGQHWLKRSPQAAVGVRSELSWGLDAQEPGSEGTESSQFWRWRGQTQYRQQLGDDWFVLAQGDVQLASRALVPLEQISLGGVGTVRGYEQGLVLADSGVLASVELWAPLLQLPEESAALHLLPFFDVGWAWNSDGAALAQEALASVGLGLHYQQDNVAAHLDWGIPLISGEGDRWRAEGLQFSISIMESW